MLQPTAINDNYVSLYKFTLTSHPLSVPFSSSLLQTLQQFLCSILRNLGSLPHSTKITNCDKLERSHELLEKTDLGLNLCSKL